MERIFDEKSELCVFCGGRGPIILFIHGFPFDHTMYDAVCARLEASAVPVRWMAVDLPGFGESPRYNGPDDVPSMAGYARRLAVMLDSLGITERIVVCGLSMGGYIALEFARSCGERLRGLVLANTRCTADSPEVAQKRIVLADTVATTSMAPVIDDMLPNLLARRTPLVSPDVVTFLQRMMARQSVEGVADAARAMAARVDTTEVLRAVAVPVLAIGADEDRPSPPATVAKMAMLAPCSRYSQIAASGHLTPLEQPERFALMISNFMKGL